MKIETVLENLVNGNLAEAKRGARKHTSFRISMYARQVLCWPFERSKKAAEYLKGEGSFQDYCDAPETEEVSS